MPLRMRSQLTDRCCHYVNTKRYAGEFKKTDPYIADQMRQILCLSSQLKAKPQQQELGIKHTSFNQYSEFTKDLL